jgi:transposase
MSPRILSFMMETLFSLVRSLLADKAELAIENLALRQQVAALKRERALPRLDDADRAFWVALKEMWSNWINSLILVTPDTVIRWQRERFNKYWAAKSRAGKRPGRPTVSRQIRDLINRMARENDWGAPRIHAELLKLGVEVSQATVSRYLPKRPAPDKVERWKKFLRNHLPDIAAMDFFTIPTASFKLLFGFFVIHHDRRRILHINVTESRSRGRLRPSTSSTTATRSSVPRSEPGSRRSAWSPCRRPFGLPFKMRLPSASCSASGPSCSTTSSS